MAKTNTFKVSKRDHEGFEITTEREPETLEEFESLNLVTNYPQDVIDLAWQNLVIKMQAGARARLDDGEDAVQEYCDNYTYGARTAGPKKPKVKLSADKAKQGKFSKAQLEMLREAGVAIEGLEAEEE